MGPPFLFKSPKIAFLTANAALVRQGKVLGGPKLHEAREAAQVVIKTNADRYAANILPLIKDAQRAGANTLRDVADALNARGVATARGGRWYATSVKNVLERPIARKPQPGER
jgi:Recombinase